MLKACRKSGALLLRSSRVSLGNSIKTLNRTHDEVKPTKKKKKKSAALLCMLSFFLSVTSSYLPWHWPTGALHLGCFQWDSLHWAALLLGSHCVFHCYTNLQADIEKGLQIRRKNKHFGMLWLHIYSHNRKTDYFSRLANGHHEDKIR